MTAEVDSHPAVSTEPMEVSVPDPAMSAFLFLALSSPAAAPPAASSGPQAPPLASQAMTLKLDHDEGADHMCPANGQLASFQANAGIDNAPLIVELLGPDHKPVADKTWSTVAGLRVLPLVQGPVRITLICSTKQDRP